MRINPSTRLKRALRGALRRRFGYAALRVLRRGLRLAIMDHVARSVDEGRAYNGTRELEAIVSLYPRAVRRLQQRWPSLRLDDKRSDP